MRGPGIFIQSYDCEGRWGVADHLSPALRAQMTGRGLNGIYSRLAAILDRHKTPGTFAFVGGFMCDAALLERHVAALDRVHSSCPGYLDSFFHDRTRGDLEGWLGADCLANVRTAQCSHEIGSHGFSHVPWNWPGFSSAIAALELTEIRAIASSLGLTISTFVFPRNGRGHLEQLARHQIGGYRDSIMWQTRGARLAREFNIWEQAQNRCAPTSPCAIPGGQFMNVRFGARKLVPSRITIARWRHIIESTCESGKIAHLWCHPENFLAAPDGLDVLDEILSLVARRRDEGRLNVMTQAAYCADTVRVTDQ